MLDPADILAESKASLETIGDLAVLVLFSVFESQVRDYLVERIKPEAVGLTDPILKKAADDAIQGIEEGSFFQRVLRPLQEKSSLLSELVERVNQVRVYRNWVAHGRREHVSDIRATKKMTVRGIGSK